MEETLDEFKERLQRNKPPPDNTALYRRTQQLFKKKRQSIKKYVEKTKNPPALPVLRTQIPVFKNRPLDFRARGQSKAGAIYRPPTWLSQTISEPKSSKVSASSASSSSKRSSGELKFVAKTKPPASPESRPLLPWPPSKDSNYFKVSNSQLLPKPRVADFKFVNCSKCG